MRQQYSTPTLIIVLTFIKMDHSSNECIFALMRVKRDSSKAVGR
jgi:hypothetical protein